MEVIHDQLPSCFLYHGIKIFLSRLPVATTFQLSLFKMTVLFLSFNGNKLSSVETYQGRTPGNPKISYNNK